MPLIQLPETGNAYVTIDELRALPHLGDDVTYTDDMLAEARDVFASTWEEFVGVAFVPRDDTYRLAGAGYRSLILPHYPVRSVTAVRLFTDATTYTAFTSDQLADVLVSPTGEIMRVTGGWWPWSQWGARNVEVDYVHGFAEPPADVKRAAKTAIQEALVQDRTARPDRTYGTATEGVFIRNIIEDEKHPFGIPGVDSVACRYRARYRIPSVG